MLPSPVSNCVINCDPGYGSTHGYPVAKKCIDHVIRNRQTNYARDAEQVEQISSQEPVPTTVWDSPDLRESTIRLMIFSYWTSASQ